MITGGIRILEVDSGGGEVWRLAKEHCRNTWDDWYPTIAVRNRMDRQRFTFVSSRPGHWLKLYFSDGFLALYMGHFP